MMGFYLFVLFINLIMLNEGNFDEKNVRGSIPRTSTRVLTPFIGQLLRECGPEMTCDDGRWLTRLDDEVKESGTCDQPSSDLSASACTTWARTEGRAESCSREALARPRQDLAPHGE